MAAAGAEGVTPPGAARLTPAGGDANGPRRGAKKNDSPFLHSFGVSSIPTDQSVGPYFVAHLRTGRSWPKVKVHGPSSRADA